MRKLRATLIECVAGAMMAMMAVMVMGAFAAFMPGCQTVRSALGVSESRSALLANIEYDWPLVRQWAATGGATEGALAAVEAGWNQAAWAGVEPFAYDGASAEEEGVAGSARELVRMFGVRIRALGK